MSRRRRLLAGLALIMMAAPISACGSSAPAATASGGSSASNNGDANHAKAVKFAACMRANGVSGFPDPGASGTLTLDGIVNGSSLNPSTPAWKRAIGVCKDLEPSGFTGHKRSAQQQAVALKFAHCVREHGVSDFPDPTPNAPLIDTNLIPSSATNSGRSILNAAMHTCGAIYASGLGLQLHR